MNGHGRSVILCEKALELGAYLVRQFLGNFESKCLISGIDLNDAD